MPDVRRADRQRQRTGDTAHRCRLALKASLPPESMAMSSSAPSGRGVAIASQAPQYTGEWARTEAANALQHRSLADAGFAFHKHQPAGACARFRPSVVELRQEPVALEQRHAWALGQRASTTSAVPAAAAHLRSVDEVVDHRLARNAAAGRRWFATAYAPTLRPSSVECSSVLRKWMPANTRASSISFSICARLV